LEVAPFLQSPFSKELRRREGEAEEQLEEQPAAVHEAEALVLDKKHMP